MALIKLRKWELFLVKRVCVPILRRLADIIHKRAAATPSTWDDILAGAFDSVIEFLAGPDAFEAT